MPEANLSLTTRTATRVGDVSVRGLLASVVGQDTPRQQVVRVEVVASGRRRVPSAVERARMADGSGA